MKNLDEVQETLKSLQSTDIEDRIKDIEEGVDFETNLNSAWAESGEDHGILICGSVFIMEKAKKLLGMKQTVDYDESINNRT